MKIFIPLPLLFALSLLIQGCSYYTFHENPIIDRAGLERSSPETLAVMPVVDRSGVDGMARTVREALYESLAPLIYRDVEMGDIDEVLATASLELSKPPVELTARDLGGRDLADVLFFSEVERPRKFWLLFYSHIKLRSRHRLVDSGTYRVLYENDVTLYKRSIAPPISIPGIAQSGVETLIGLRGAEVHRVFKELGENLARDFPVPRRTSPHDIGIDAIFVSFENPILRRGDRLDVEVRGTPGQMVTCNIGIPDRNLRAVEVSPGTYRVLYVVEAGDQTDAGVVQATMETRLGQSVVRSNLDMRFRINAVAPPRPEIQDVRFLSNGLSLYLGIPRLDEGTRLEIYRTRDPEKGYLPVDRITGLTWIDRRVEPGTTYWYLVKAIDPDGQASMYSEPRMVEVPQKGPSLLPATLSGTVVLHRYSSPYQVMETTTLTTGSTLVVERGVRIQVWPGARIRSYGEVRFEGTEDEPIRVTGRNGGTLLELFASSPDMEFRLMHTVFRNAMTGVFCSGGELLVENCFFGDIGEGVVLHDAASARISRSEFRSFGSAIAGSAQSLEVDYTLFRRGSQAVVVDSPNLMIHNNDILRADVAIGQHNATVTRIDNNYLGTVNPSRLFQLLQGPVVFTHLYSRPSAERYAVQPLQESHVAWLARADRYYSQRDFRRAQEAYRSAWLLRKDRETGMRLYSLLRSAGSFEDAARVAETLVIMHPFDEGLLSQYARALEEAGMPDAAQALRRRMAQ